MKKLLALMLAAVMALSLAACGGSGDTPKDSDSSSAVDTEPAAPDNNVPPDNPSEEGAPPEEAPGDEEREVPGSYENISLFLTSTYQINENGSYDKANPEEKGTYTVKDDGSFELVQKGMGNGDIFTPYQAYYYRSNLICSFEKDKEYGLAPSFDENGHSTQTFEAYYEPTNDGNQNFVSFTMNDDGTFLLQKQVRNTDGFLTVVDKGDAYEGEYTLDGEILTLTWKDFQFPLLFIDGQIYFDVIEKQSDENATDAAARRAALEAFREEKYAPVDDALAGEISSNLQGEWEYTNNGIKFVLVIDGNNISVTSTAGGASISNQGTYIVCKDFVLITYETGKRAKMEYTNDNGDFSLYPLQGIED